jgi:hypothetical protein
MLGVIARSPDDLGACKEVWLKVDARIGLARVVREHATLVEDFPGEAQRTSTSSPGWGRGYSGWGRTNRVGAVPDFFAEVKAPVREAAIA